MSVIPAYCTHCGTLFESRAFSFGANVRGLRLEGNKEECPKCHRLANIIDGSFDITNGAIAMISGPAITKEILQRFGVLAQRAINKEITTEQLEKQANDLDPTLGDMVRKIKLNSVSTSFVLLLMLTYLKGCQFHVDAKLDINELFNQISSHGTILPSSVDRQTKDSQGKEKRHTDAASHSSKPKPQTKNR